MMKFNEFVNAVENTVEKILREERNNCKVEISNVVKNNGLNLVVISIKHENETIVPIIYLRSYYEEYKSGTATIKALAQEIIKADSDARKTCLVNETLNLTMKNYEKISKNIKLRIVNYELNRKELVNIPFEEFLDLAIICYIDLGSVSSIVTKNLFDCWNITKEELFKLAYKNTKMNKFRCVPMYKMIREEMLTMGQDKNQNTELMTDSEQMSGQEDEMYVVTNVQKRYGAISIISFELLEKIRKVLGSNYYIIPSSIHEILVVKAESIDTNSTNNINSIIQDINRSELELNEILSDHAYYFDGNMVSIV